MVQSVDYGWIGTVPLKSLCELPPGFSDLPPQAIRSKLAGIQKKPGLQTYPDIVKDMLIAVKKKRKVSCYSTIMSVFHIHERYIHVLDDNDPDYLVFLSPYLAMDGII